MWKDLGKCFRHSLELIVHKEMFSFLWALLFCSVHFMKCRPGRGNVTLLSLTDFCNETLTSGFALKPLDTRVLSKLSARGNCP